MDEQNNGKVQRSAADWQALQERYEQSGLGPSAFCRQEGLVFNSFKKRYYEHKRAMRPTLAFVELSPPPAPAARGWELELTLPH